MDGRRCQPTATVLSGSQSCASYLGTRSFPPLQGDLRFVRVFDKARYGDLLLFMDKLQKTYMYILAGRYEVQSYVGTFQDLRESVSEILYSLYFAVPLVVPPQLRL